MDSGLIVISAVMGIAAPSITLVAFICRFFIRLDKKIDVLIEKHDALIRRAEA